MKIGALNRTLLIILMLILLVIAGLCIAFAAGAFPKDVLANAIMSLNMDVLFSIIVAIVSFVIFIAALKMLFMGATKREPVATMIRMTEYGQINITLEALNHLVLKSAYGVDGVRDVKSSLRTAQGGSVRILLRVATSSDSVIPEVIEKLQLQIKTFIESHVGVPVVELQVMVDNTMALGTGLPRVQ